MYFNFRNAAQDELTLSHIMDGRTQIHTEDIIGQDVTLDEFDIVVLDGKKFTVVHFNEYPDRYYNAGMLITKLADVWAAGFDGDIESASTELKKCGGVKFRFSAAKTKKGNNITNIEVL